ncbi:hypothetical protein AAE121_002315 [Salmonella enterica]
MSKYKVLLSGLVVSTCAFASSAFADSLDYTTMTNAFDFGTTVAAVMSVAAGACVLMLAMVGAKKVFQFIRAI